MIPVHGEGAAPIPLLRRLASYDGVVEVWVVESEEDPLPVPRPDPCPSGLRFVLASRGRAIQMNSGARLARGETLLFLHADCWIEEAGLAELRWALRRESAGPVAFRLGYRERHPGLRALALAGNALSSVSAYALGDQGLGIRRRAFLEAGGFPEVPILEDWILLRRLRKTSGLRILGSTCWTSGRRFLREGIGRQLWRNLRILYRYGEGDPLDELAEEYAMRGGRTRSGAVERSFP